VLGPGLRSRPLPAPSRTQADDACTRSNGARARRPGRRNGRTKTGRRCATAARSCRRAALPARRRMRTDSERAAREATPSTVRRKPCRVCDTFELLRQQVGRVLGTRRQTRALAIAVVGLEQLLGIADVETGSLEAEAVDRLAPVKPGEELPRRVGRIAVCEVAPEQRQVLTVVDV